MPTRPYRILVVADSALPVPPSGYGGTERVVAYLIDELSARGHSITLIAKAGSRSPGRLIPYDDQRAKSKLHRGLAKWTFHRLLKRELPQHDIVHGVARLDYLLPALRSSTPTVLNFQNPLCDDQVGYVERHGQGKIVLTACGERMIEPFAHRGDWRAVHNCVDVRRFTFHPHSPSPPTPLPVGESGQTTNRYLAFLGRLIECKGVADAIEVARQSGLPLLIGGNIGPTPEDRAYFRERIEPHLDGRQVRYLGELNDPAKITLLGGALALVNPIHWEEPFGIVNVEALACGTPVLTYARGEPPHLLRDGVTGFVCRDLQHMIQRVAEVHQLDRFACRRDAESRFSVSTMVDKVESIYDEVLGSKC